MEFTGKWIKLKKKNRTKNPEWNNPDPKRQI